MLSDQDLNLIAWLLEENRKPAILLYPPFPPHPAIRVRSKIGGRPSLPADYPWPIGKLRGKPTPLHFLAQVDCAELPRFGHGLPTTGVLFFFACDMDHIWDSKIPGEDACVLYVEKMPLDVTDREPPDDLPPIREAYASNGNIVAYGCLPGEAGPRIHVEWPLAAQKIDSWPSADSFEDIGKNFEKSFPGRTLSFREVLSLRGEDERKYKAATRLNQEIAEAYNERVRLKRSDAFVGVTGITNKNRFSNLGWNPDVLHYHEPWTTDGVRFPQLGIMIDRLARHAIKGVLSKRNSRTEVLRENHEMRIHAIVDAAHGWITRAREIGSLGRPSEADVNAINSWLTDIHGERGHGPWGQQRSDLNLDTGQFVRNALLDTCLLYTSPSPRD